MKRIAYWLVSLLMLGSINIYAATTDNLEKCGKNDPYHILINKDHVLSPTYKPDNLVIPNVTFESPGNIEKNYMEATAAKALEEMFVGAKKDGIRLVAVSGYRSYNRQTALYRNAVYQYGKNQIGTAAPGQSEHQSGLAMDLNSISQSFQYTKEGKWLAKNAHTYGFIIRYPKGKTDITGYIYEPWHVRYVGKELATYCYTNNLTLEELDECCQKDIEVNMTIEMAEQGEGKVFTLLKRDGVTYIKIRDLLANIGGNVQVEKPMFTLNTNHHTLTLTEDSKEAFLDDEPGNIAYTPIRINGSIYVPIRSILNLVDFQLEIPSTTTLLISSLSSHTSKEEITSTVETDLTNE